MLNIINNEGSTSENCNMICYTTIKVTKIERQIISNVDEDVGEVKLIQCSHTLTLKKQFVIFL